MWALQLQHTAFFNYYHQVNECLFRIHHLAILVVTAKPLRYSDAKSYQS